MRRAHVLSLRDALALEALRGKRDARYRANLAFTARAIRSILLTIAIGTSLAWGWPVPARLIVSRVATGVSTETNRSTMDGLGQFSAVGFHSEGSRDRSRALSTTDRAAGSRLQEQCGRGGRDECSSPTDGATRVARYVHLRKHKGRSPHRRRHPSRKSQFRDIDSQGTLGRTCVRTPIPFERSVERDFGRPCADPTSPRTRTRHGQPDPRDRRRAPAAA